MKRFAQMLFVIAVVAALALHGRAQGPAASARTAEIDKIFARWNAATPGCAVGARTSGATDVFAAYGMADLEHDVRNTPETIFEAGSVAKQFTATAVLLLARDAKLSLEDPVRKFIPEVPDYGTPITIRQMLSHTSGLRDWGNITGIAGWPRGTRTHAHEHVLDVLTRQKALNFTPGTRWSYSNSGYNLAAILVTRVSGMSFAEFSRVRIFEPLGMRHTSWRDDFTRIVKHRAVAYVPEGQNYSMQMPFENVHGNGGLLTTVGDLLTWNAHLVAPRIGDAAMVKEQQTPVRFPSGREHGYGLGLVVGDYKGVREVSHGGATAGYRAFLVQYPDRGVSIAVLCNAANANPTQYAHAVAELLLGSAIKADAALASPVPEAQGPLTALKRDASFNPRGDALADFAGTYTSDEAETTLIVSIESDALIVRRRPASRIVLRPLLKDTFESDGDLGTIMFRRDAAGRVGELSVIQDRVWDLRFKKQAAASNP